MIKWLWVSVWVAIVTGALLVIGGLNGSYVAMRWLQVDPPLVEGARHRLEAAWGYIWPGTGLLAYGAVIGLGIKVAPIIK